MILICYDGSDDAKAAIASAQTLFEGKPATVLTVWEPFADILASKGAKHSILPDVTEVEKIDEASHTNAAHIADEGAAIANDAGLDATAKVANRVGTVARTILDEADAANVDAIVLGSRGLTGMASLLLGSVSHAVLQAASRSVVTVPSPEVAARRRERRHGDAHSVA